MVKVALLLALAACGDDAITTAPLPTPPVARVAADPSVGATTELDGAAPSYYEGVLAELAGSDPRAAFERVLASPDVPTGLAARAALHLAQLDVRAKDRRNALDHVARAATLAPNDLAIAEGVAQLEADLGAATGGADVRGPALGSLLAGVPADVAEAFAAAERANAEVHRIHPRAFIEALSSSVRYKEDATESAVAKYRAIAERGGLALVAANYRAGSLYHDLALGLLFELPPELDPAVAQALRRTLRASSLAYLKRAVELYQAALAAPAVADAQLWRLAAETDLREARVVLGESAQ